MNLQLKGVRVCVVGAGVAGLTAACSAASMGAEVTVVERSPYAGGRARSFVDSRSGIIIDNGQHILLNCYTKTKEFLRLVDSTEFVIAPLSVEWREKGRSLSKLNPRGNGRIALASSLLLMNHLAWSDRLNLLVGIYRSKSFQAKTDESVSGWLRRMRQRPAPIKYFWEPLCVAVMNEALDTAKSGLFQEVLRRMFGDRNGTSLIWNTNGLSALLVAPAERYLKQRRGAIHFLHTVDEIMETASTVGVKGNQSVLYFDFVIVTIPPWTLSSVFHNAIEHVTGSIVSAYVWFSQDVERSSAMIGCFGTTIQWITWKGPRLASLTVSAASGLSDRTAGNIEEIFRTELEQILGIPKSSIERILVLKERRATARVDGKPPENTHRVIMAGDWTHAKLPCTIEGACESGFEAVAQVAARIRN